MPFATGVIQKDLSALIGANPRILTRQESSTYVNKPLLDHPKMITIAIDTLQNGAHIRREMPYSGHNKVVIHEHRGGYDAVLIYGRTHRLSEALMAG